MRVMLAANRAWKGLGRQQEYRERGRRVIEHGCSCGRIAWRHRVLLSGLLVAAGVFVGLDPVACPL